MRHDEQTLVFDADDTLWENNIRFERAIETFLDLVVPPAGDRAGARAVLDGIEAATARLHGYGTGAFLHSLRGCFEEVHGRLATAAERKRLTLLADSTRTSQVELIPGVAQTLSALATRHHLLLLTKGDHAEQQAKVDGSGLAGHFRAVHIVAEKNVSAYQRLIGEHALSPDRTWMIGNSPKSDILPARRAGWNAVFIPHPHTWVLEQQKLDPLDTGVLRLTAFTDLGEHF